MHKNQEQYILEILDIFFMTSTTDISIRLYNIKFIFIPQNYLTLQHSKVLHKLFSAHPLLPNP